MQAVMLCTGLLMAAFACNQDFERLIPEREYTDSATVSFGNPKVLYLIVDGARGQSVEAAETPNINTLLPDAIHTWVSLSDETADSKGTSWADMLTGVRKNKHGIAGNDFSENNLDDFPLVFERVKEAQPETRIEAYTRSSLFEEYFTAGTDESEVLSTDQAVKDAVTAALAGESAGFILGHFGEVEAAGEQYGYDVSKAGYKSAIEQFDTYLGEIMETLENRPDYAEENWLVIVTSSRGGDYPVPEEENDNTVFSKPPANTFTIFYSLAYQTRFIGKPYLGSRLQGDFVRFNEQRKAEVDSANNAVYNLGDEDQEFTIELKVRKNPGPDGNYKFYYPAILGKRPEWSSGWPSNGWVIFLEDNFWMFNARGTGGGQQVRGGTLADATWNSIAVVGVIRENRRYVRTFTNGSFNNETDITGWGNLDNEALLTMGYINGNGHGEPDVYISDVRIWKAALSDETIGEFSCETFVDSNHPYYNSLAGYWPVFGSSGNAITDQGPLRSDMTLSGGELSWDYLREYICAPSAEGIGSLVPSSTDIPAQILSWLKIARQESWQLDGRVWLDQ